MNKKEAKQFLQNIPPDKRQRLYDAMVKVFSRLEADWKAKPENVGKPVKYTELWKEHLKKTKEGDSP